MKLTLRRSSFTEDGIFGALFDEEGTLLVHTLEHAYPAGEKKFLPKVPPGEYECKRGPHKLRANRPYFDTFEVQGVEGHDGILFHTGNFQEDSKGCILVGSGITGTVLNQSRIAFQKFMGYLKDEDTFTLVVKPEVV